MSLTIDIHALQTLPPSNINRDDTGAPKSATFGGVPRQRVSSQSWKRAIRADFEDRLPAGTVGYRTKMVVDLIADAVREKTGGEETSWTEEKSWEAAEQFLKVGGIKTAKAKPKKGDDEDSPTAPATGYLFFISPRQIDAIADYIVEHDGEKPSKKEAKQLLDSEHSIDIAMFGRMIADAPDFNVDAAVQVAHAIGIHESEPEFDYFTAVDDVVEDREETGAGMIGTVQMMSSTLYRFATIDLASLQENLGDRATSDQAAVAFLTSFITSLPTGKQNTFAHNTLPELVYVTVRDTRSVSLVNAFEGPVRAAEGEDRRVLGARRLASEASEVEENYIGKPVAAFVLGLGALVEPFANLAERITLPELESRVQEALNSGAQA